MTKKLDFMHEITYVIMELLFYYLLFLTFQNVYYSDHIVPYFEGVKLLPLVLFVYLIRKYVKNVFAFLGLHIVLLMLMFAMNLDAFCKVLYVVFFAVQLLQSLSFWKAEKAKPYKEMPVAFIFLFFIMAIYGQNVSKEYYYLICGMGIFYCFMYLAEEYLKQYSEFLKSQNEMKRFPYKKINLIHNMHLSILMGIFIGLLFLVILLKPEKIVGVIGAFLFQLLRSFFSRLAKTPVEKEVEVSTEEQGVKQDFFGEGFEDQMPKNETLLKIMEMAFNVLCVIAILVCIFLVIYGIFEFFKKYMKKNLMDSDEVTEIKKEKKEKIKKREKEKTSFFLRFTGTNAEKIRKMYYKKMKLYEKKQELALKEYLTPEELRKMVEENTKDQIEEMTRYYEEARYAKEEQTKEKVLSMKASIPR